MILRYLYGFIYKGYSFNNNMEVFMRDLDLKGSSEDKYTWMKPAVKSCIYKYCEYVNT